MDKKKRLLTGVLAAVLILVAAVLGARAYRENTDEAYILSRIYQLPVHTTAEDLEEEGFLNLTEIQPKRLEKVSRYFTSPEGNSVLKTFAVTDEGTLIRVYSKNKHTGQVHETTYHLQEQYAIPNYTYRCKCEEVKTGEGITEVWLRADKPQWADTIQHKDRLLYSYADS